MTSVAHHPTAPVRVGKGVRAVLADGPVVLLRSLDTDDRDTVLRLHKGLDEHDRYFRFFGPRVTGT